MSTPIKTLTLIPPKAPNLLIAPVDYTQQYQDQFSNALRLYFNQIDNFASGVNSIYSSAATIPTVGTWPQGAIVYNSAPVAGGYIGWVCVKGGTPGTWKTWGVISS